MEKWLRSVGHVPLDLQVNFWFTCKSLLFASSHLNLCLFISPLFHFVYFWHQESEREQEKKSERRKTKKERETDALVVIGGFSSSSWSCDWFPGSATQSWPLPRSCGLCSKSLEEQEESGLEQGEGLMASGNRGLPDLETTVWPNPRAALAAMGNSEGWLRKREEGSPDRCPPEPPISTLLTPSRLEMV